MIVWALSNSKTPMVLSRVPWSFAMLPTRLIYISENIVDPAKGSVTRQLSQILSASIRNNKRLEITGALVFDDSWFLQALEGERGAVWQTFERIKDDERHACVQVVDFRTVTERMFGNWWMGLATRNEHTAEAFAPFVKKGRLVAQEMTGDEILSLMVDLTRVGLSRVLAA